MVLFAYTIPALAWLASVCVESKMTKNVYASVYFVCHAVVEIYGFWVPIIWFFVKEDQYEQMTADQMQQVRDYLIFNSVVFGVALIITSYCTACLCSHASIHSARRSQASIVYSPSRQQYVEMQQQDNYIGGGYYQPN